jgi:trigger factor
MTFTSDELQAAHNAGYKKTQPEIQMQGFRKGKVPFNLIKKFYGPSIEAEAEESMINKEFGEYSKKENKRIIGSPSLTDVKKDNGILVATVQFETMPEFNVVGIKDLEVDEPVHVVTDLEIEAELSNLELIHGVKEEVSVVADSSHVVKIDVKPINAETGEPVGEATENEVYLNNPNNKKGLSDLFLDKKVGDNFDYINPDDEKDRFNITIAKIEKLTPPALDKEFIEKLSEGRLSDLEDLKQDIELKLQARWDENSRQIMENQVIGKIVELNPIEVPSELLDNGIKIRLREILKQQGMKENDMKNINLEMFRPMLQDEVTRGIRWELIRERLIEQEQIEVEDFDIDTVFDNPALRHLILENGEVSEEKRQTMIANIRNDEKMMLALADKKLMQYIMDFVRTNELSYEEYEKKNNVRIHGDHVHELDENGNEIHNHDHDHHDHDHHHHDHDHHEHEEIQEAVVVEEAPKKKTTKAKAETTTEEKPKRIRKKKTEEE